MKQYDSILEIARKYRAQLLALDEESLQRISEVYESAYGSIEFDLELLLERIQDELSAGRPITADWLRRQERYRQLLFQVMEQIDSFGQFSTDYITENQRILVRQAVAGARDMFLAEQGNVRALIGYTWNRIPYESLQHLVGFLSDGSPLADLFEGLGETSARIAKEVLTTAVLKGTGPLETARQMKDAFGGNISRARTVARTEQLRSYREASAENYKANEDVLEGWIRYETLDELTCMVCVLEHGKVYKLDEPFAGHPNCRGTQIPKVIGLDRDIRPGSEWFEGLTPEEQKDKMGKKKWESWKNGDFKLTDMVEVTTDEKWGEGRRIKRLEELL